MRLGTILMAFLVLVLGALPVMAQEKRIALLIGNKDYKPGVGALVNPLNDVRVVGDALRTVGFEVMAPVTNATRDSILLAVHDFGAKLKDAGKDAVGFLYYSGHGIASGSDNFMIPVDVDEPSTRLLSVRGVKHTEVLSILRSEAPNAAHYIVLDACRNNLQGARGGKGFVPVGQQSGVLFAFSAEPGKTASDTGQGSGPYAAALAAELKKPGQDDLRMFHNVRVAVMDKTGGDQVPWTEDGIQRRERVMFGGAAQQAAPVTSPQAPMSEAAQAWSATQNSISIAVLEAFARQYPNTVFATMARARIEEVRQSQKANLADPTATTSKAELSKSGYDGSWQMARTSPACKTPNLTATWTVTAGRIVSSKCSGRCAGSISADGSVVFVVTSNDGSGTYNGKVSDRRGSGSFVGKGAGLSDCYGSFVLTKN